MKNAKKALAAVVCAGILLTECNSQPIREENGTDSGNPPETRTARPEQNLAESPYTVNNFAFAKMEVIRSDRGKVTVSIESENQNACTFGEFYALEVKQDGIWHTLPYATQDQVAFHSIGYEVNRGEKREWTADFEWLYEPLPAGEYRIVKDILDFRGTGDYDTYYLAAEFTVV